jgi:O-antigen/teichoic acid export membrane protein
LIEKTYKRIKKYWQNESFIRNVGVLAGGTVASQLILILASPLLTRLYTPSDFGILAIYTSILNLIVVVSGLRYEVAIPLPEKDETARHLLAISFLWNGVFTVLTILGVAVWILIKADFTDVEYLWLLPIGVFFFGSYKILNYWAIRKKMFGRITRTKFYQSSSSVLVQSSLGAFGLGPLGLILGQIMGQSAGFTTLSKNSGLKGLLGKVGGNYHLLKNIAKKYRKFPLYDAPASLLNVLSNELPQLLFAALFNPAIAGVCLLSQKVLGAPLRIIGQSISQVLYGNILERITQGTIRKITVRIVLTLSVLVVLPSLLILFQGEYIFRIVFGEDWSQAGKYAAVLIMILATQFVYSPISLVLLALNGQKTNLMLQIAMIVIKTISILAGWLQNDPYKAVLYFSVFGSLVYIAGIAIIINRTGLPGSGPIND